MSEPSDPIVPKLKDLADELARIALVDESRTVQDAIRVIDELIARMEAMRNEARRPVWW